MAHSHTNPFGNETGSDRVLVNEEGQRSPWPGFVAEPAGWRSSFGPESRVACLEYVRTSWLDLRPAGLVAASARQQGHRT